MRDRLDIEPGQEVNFRIRGQVLIVELETDIQQNIKYLNSVDLSTDSLDETQAHEIISDLLNQQFYNGNDNLTDRVGKRIIKIRGTDAIVTEVLNILTHSSRFWINGNPVETLREFSKDFDLDFPTLVKKFSDKIRNMLLGGEDLIAIMGGEVVFAMAVGEALSQFRTRVGDIVTESLFKNAIERGYVKKLGVDTIEDLITRSLADDYSILMNLRVLKEFAKVNLKSVGQRKYRELSEEMLDSFKHVRTPEHVIKRRERRQRRKKGSSVTKQVYENEIPPEDEKPLETFSDEEDMMPDLPSFDF